MIFILLDIDPISSLLLLLQFLERFPFDRLEDVERAAKRLIDVKNACIVVEFSAVVWGWKDCYEAAVSHELVAVLNNLVRSADKIELMSSVELLDYIWSENIAHTSVVITPALDVDLWVWPEQITQKASIRHILWSLVGVYHLDIIQIWTKTAVHTQYPIINNRTNWQNIEDGAELSPQFDTIPSFALVIKAVHPVNGLAFVVASEQEEVIRVLNFIRHQETDCFDTLFASIDVVSDKEKLLVIMRIAGNIKKSEKVEKLTMHITKYFDRCLQV